MKLSKPKPKKQDKQELYGLDLDFLKELDLGDMLEDMQDSAS